MAIITGTSGNNELIGTTGADGIFALEGNDTIFGGGGGDTLDGGSDNDYIGAQAGDIITTGAGQDTISSNFSSFTVTDFTPGAGGDVLLIWNGLVFAAVGLPSFSSGLVWVSQNGADAVLNVGPIFLGTSFKTTNTEITLKNVDAGALTAANIASFDYPNLGYPEGIVRVDPQVGAYRGGPADDVLVGSSGNDHLWGAGGKDTLFGGSGDDTHSGGAGNDLIVDDLGSDALNGDAGDDTLWGGAGVDYLFGGAGDDLLVGQAGGDLFSGGAGADRFFVGEGNDWITDFSRAEGDRLYLPTGVTFTLTQYDFGGAMVLSNGAVIGLQGVTVSGLTDWVTYV